MQRHVFYDGPQAVGSALAESIEVAVGVAFGRVADGPQAKKGNTVHVAHLDETTKREKERKRMEKKDTRKSEIGKYGHTYGNFQKNIYLSHACTLHVHRQRHFPTTTAIVFTTTTPTTCKFSPHRS